MSGHIFQEVERDEGVRLDFVGDFEAKYEAEVDPWEQSGESGERAAYYEYSRRKVFRRLVGRLNEDAYGIEIGCGHGYLTEILAKGFHMTGVDVSESALERAEVLHPGINYVRGDITAEGFKCPGAQYHFLVLAQCWWYVLHEFEQTMQNCLDCLMPGGLFVLSQAFLKEQKYGRDIADGFDGALKLLMSYPGVRLVEAHYDDTGLLCYHDGIVMMRKVVSTNGVEP